MKKAIFAGTLAVFVLLFMGCGSSPESKPNSQAERVLSFGTKESGTLKQNEKHKYSIQAERDDTVLVNLDIEMYDSVAGSRYFLVYDDSKNIISETSIASQKNSLSIPIQAGKSYFFELQNRNQGVYTYSLIFRSNFARVEQLVRQSQELIPGTEISGTLSNVSYVMVPGERRAQPRVEPHWLHFQTSKDDTVIVEILEGRDITMEVYNDSSLSSIDNNRSGRKTRLEIPTKAGRTYFISLNANSSAAYRFNTKLNSEIQQQQQAQQQAAAAAAAAAAAELTRPLRDEDFRVKQNADNTITITGFNLSKREVVIPEKLFGLQVTIIANDAFSGKGLTAVVIPNTVKTIGNSAFSDNQTLTTVTIPNSVTEIGSRAFKNCGLTSVTFGSGLRKISGWAFQNNKLTSVTLPNGIREVLNEAFLENRIASVSIPGSIQTLGGTNDWGAVGQMFGVSGLQGVVVFAGAFSGSPITRAVLPANMSNDNLRNFEESLRNFYTSQNKVAGTYVKNGPVWGRQ